MTKAKSAYKLILAAMKDKNEFLDELVNKCKDSVDDEHRAYALMEYVLDTAGSAHTINELSQLVQWVLSWPTYRQLFSLMLNKLAEKAKTRVEKSATPTKDADLEDIDELIEAFKGEELPSGNTLERGLVALEKLRREGRIH